MFAAPQIYQVSKDDIKSALPLKTRLSSLDNFTQPADRLESEKSVSKVNQSCSKISLGEKGSSNSKLKAQEAKASHKDFWTDERKLMLESDNNFRTGLKPCSLDNFTQSAGAFESEKFVFKVDQSYSKISLGEKENSKPKIKDHGTKASHKDFWTDERNLLQESNSDYEDNLSFLAMTSDLYELEPSDNESPSPFSLKAPDLDFSDFSPSLPEFDGSLFEYDDLKCFTMPDLEFPLQKPIIF